MNKARNNNKNLLITEDYSDFIEYAYPVIQRVPRIHGVVKLQFLEAVFKLNDDLHLAVRNTTRNQVLICKGRLDNINYYLRFSVDKNRRMMSRKQFNICSRLLKEVDSKLDEWVQRFNKARK